MPPPPDELLARAAALWLFGFVLVVGVSAYLAQGTRTQGGYLWVGGVLAIIGQLATVVGAIAAGKAVAGLIDNRTWVAPAAGLFVILGLIWATSIMIQIGQNVCYRAMNLRTHPIRWINRPSKKRQRRKQP